MSLRQLLVYSVEYSQTADLDQLEIDHIMSYSKDLTQKEIKELSKFLEVLRN